MAQASEHSLRDFLIGHRVSAADQGYEVDKVLFAGG
jgi:hypothetical protein